MKQICLLITALLLLTATHAQKQFDSAAYTKFYQKQWPKYIYTSYAVKKELTQEEKIAGLSKCWAEAKYNFANFDLVPDLKWDRVFQAYIPKVLATISIEDYYKVLQNFYQHLRDGHTSISLPREYYKNYTGVLPIELRWIEDKVIVSKNISATREDQVIRPGMELVSFDHVPILEYIKEHISPYLSFSTPQDSTERIYRYELTAGKVGSEVALTFKTADGKQVTRTMQRIDTKKFRELYPLIEFKVLNGNIGYLLVNSFNDTKVVKLFDSLFSSIAKTSALIIDIRNNGGGNGNNGFEMLACLTDKPFYPGKTILRQYRPIGREWGEVENPQIMGYDWKPYKNQLYTKPVVVLTSGSTYSAAEDFTCAFKYIKRGKVIGTATGGSTGQPISFALPGGGSGRVCAKRDFFWDGTEFVGIGIQPDVEVKATRKGVQAGKDEVLEEAVRYVNGQL